MEEEVKKRIAQFRFGVIADLTGGRRLTRGERERIIREKSACEWDIPYSGRSYISRSTILNWLMRYEKSGRQIESLYPQDREDKGKTRAIAEDEALALMNLKKELKGASLPVIMRVARQRNILSLQGSKQVMQLYIGFFKGTGLWMRNMHRLTEGDLRQSFQTTYGSQTVCTVHWQR